VLDLETDDLDHEADLLDLEPLDLNTMARDQDFRASPALALAGERSNRPGVLWVVPGR
jgi:hypothetical protein